RKEPPEGSHTFASGWGVLKYGDVDDPERLQGVYLDTISMKKCQDIYEDKKIYHGQICTYSEGKDTCRMDSGGPLVWNQQLLGIVSWGKDCGKKYPGVYISVPSYLKWIYSEKMSLKN
uniref:Peptidase S1 domain-containing protein n=1 Tax=Megaselia scalaris TaxID=36166 RepID=T1GEI2_MEGSC